MKVKKGIIGIVLSLVIVVIGIVFVSQGFDKKNNYEGTDEDSRLISSSVNAYVGGDAYNYIINAGYFAGYCALGGSLFVCGAVLLCGSVFLLKKENKEEEEEAAKEFYEKQSAKELEKEGE